MRVSDDGSFDVLSSIIPINLAAALTDVVLYASPEGTVTNIKEIDTNNQAAGILTFAYYILDTRGNKHYIVNSTRAATTAAVNLQDIMLTSDQTLKVDLSNAGYPAAMSIALYGRVYCIE